jgi:hypothetical protein
MDLHERLLRKHAFIPAQPAQDPSAAPAPGGAPSGAGAPPADPSAAGGDPTAALSDPNAPPADPNAAPADPAAGPAMPAPGAADGATPAPSQMGDPAADAQAQQDASAASDPSLPPTDPNASVTAGQAGVVMDIVERTLTAVGKNKKTAPPTPGGPAGPGGDPSMGGAPADPNAPQPGPVTGVPGDMSAIAGGGPLKM